MYGHLRGGSNALLLNWQNVYLSFIHSDKRGAVTMSADLPPAFLPAADSADVGVPASGQRRSEAPYTESWFPDKGVAYVALIIWAVLVGGHDEVVDRCTMYDARHPGPEDQGKAHRRAPSCSCAHPHRPASPGRPCQAPAAGPTAAQP